MRFRIGVRPGIRAMAMAVTSRGSLRKEKITVGVACREGSRPRCLSWRIRTSILVGGRQLGRWRLISKGRVGRIHSSKCSNNRPFSVGRTSLNGKDSSTIRRTTQWTSRTRRIRPSHPTRLPPIPGTGVARHPLSRRTLIRATILIRLGQLELWAVSLGVEGKDQLVASSSYRL